MNKNAIVVAGATGALGKKIVSALVQRGANGRALVRETSAPADVAELQQLGAEIGVVDMSDAESLARVCDGAACVVSAVAGLRPVIIDAQQSLLHAAVQAGVPRFIPSDFAIDFYQVADGRNRNLDLRREFGQMLDDAPIKGTSILNGIFSEYLFSPAPFVTFPIKRCIYFGSRQQAIDLTAMDDVAAYTALAALDDNTPRHLRIAGNVCQPDDLAREASLATGKKFKPMWGGPLPMLRAMIAVGKMFDVKKRDLYPAWQGMQYTENMCSGAAKLQPLDNDRYANMTWTPLHVTLAAGKPDFLRD